MDSAMTHSLVVLFLPKLTITLKDVVENCFILAMLKYLVNLLFLVTHKVLVHKVMEIQLYKHIYAPILNVVVVSFTVQTQFSLALLRDPFPHYKLAQHHNPSFSAVY